MLKEQFSLFHQQFAKRIRGFDFVLNMKLKQEVSSSQTGSRRGKSRFGLVKKKIQEQVPFI